MSESPEEQPTGVLGRIGSWLSPWRGKGPTSPTEQASPTGNQTIWLEGEEESEETVRPRPRERQWEKEKEQSFNSSPRGFYRDATQSARRDGPVASGTETAAGGGGPKEVEFEERTKKRTGQGKEREESSSSTWTANRNPEKYASHLTHLSSSSEQGAVRDTDRGHNQPVAQTQAHQAQAGKRLQWYLEETSVIQDGQDTAGQGAAVCTEIKKGLQVLPKAKASSGLDSPKSSRGSPSAERKRTNVSPAVGGTQSYYSALVGVSLKPRIDSQSEAESVQGETEADSMGRKNSAKRKFRKNSQGDGGETPPNAQLVKEGLPTSGNSVTSPQGKSPKTHTGESSVSSSSKLQHPTSQASPEGVESKASCPDVSKQSDNFPDSNSAVAAALECVFDGALDMEDVDSLYKVERKTETPESKRRSLKVSRSEVKLFTKYVPLKKSQPGENQDSVSAFKDTKDEAKDEPTTETYTRPQELKKIEEQPKPITGRIADKISLFEHPAGGLINQTLQTRRSSDASPVTNVSDRLKANLELSEQRSRSAERYDTARSGSASRVEEKQMTVKERARNFAASSKDERPTLPPKPATTGLSPSKLTKLGNQGKLDTKEQTGATSEMTSKQDGRDSPAVGKKTSSPKEQLKDLKTKVTVASKTNDQGKKPNSVETDIPAKGPGVSTELSNESPQPKSPGRATSRSKRRKSREPTSPMSPNSESKSFFSAGKPEITAVKQEQLDNKKDTASPSKQLTEKDSLASDKAHRNQSDTEPCSDTKQKAFKKEFKVMDKQNKQLDSSFKKENISKQVNRKEGLPEPSVNKNELDTAACSRGTKTPIDKDSSVLPQKEETAGEHSLSFTQQTGKVSKDIRETSASTPSPAVERPIEEAPLRQKEPPIEHLKLDKELSMQSETKLKGKATEPKKNDAGQTQQPQNKATKLVKQAESKDVEKAEKEEANRPEDKDNGKSKQLLPSDKNIPRARVSESGQGISQGSVARDGERKNASRKEETQPVKGITKSETNQPEQSSEKKLSGHPAQTQHVKQTKPTDTQKTAMCALIQTNEAVSGTLINKGPSKGETATNVPPELKTISTQSPGTETAVIAAEPQLYTVSVGQKENSQNDSSTRGAIDALLSSTKPITKATRIIEGVSVKAGKEPTQTNVSKSVSSEGAEQGDGKNISTVKSMQSEENISGDIMKVTSGRPQCEESQSTKSTSEITSVKCADKKAHRPTDSSASNSTVTMVERTAEKTIQSPRKEHPPVANGDISPLTQLSNKTSQKALSSPDSKKMSPDSVQRPILKKLPFPRGLSKDDSAMLQDAPSSWLDVDIPKEKLKVMAPRLSTSGSESNLLDTPDLDDDDFVEKIKKLCAPFSLPPRKHNQFRPPQPPFALPAIREDRFEKTFDPEEFMFGLSKKKFSAETGPSALALLKKGETKSGMKPARSVLLSGLDSHSRLRDKADDDNVFEEKDERVKVKSRLEGSCVFSSLSSSNFRAKRTGVQQQTDGTTSGDVSPSEDPRTSPPSLTQPIRPSHTATASFKDTLAKQSPTPSSREEAQAAESVVSDSSPPFPSFNDIKLPNYLEKYLPREPAKPMQSIQGKEQARTEVIGKMTTRATTDEADMAVKPGQLLPEAMPPCFPGIPPTKQTTLPELKKPTAQPQAILSNKIRTPKGFHKRPGKIVLFEEAQFSGQVYEIYRDVADATSLQFSPFISVKVIRGCWVLYEKPDFQGRSIPLEEGGIELENMWAEPGQVQSSPPMSIGSIRHAVWDYSIPRIDLFTEPEGHGRVTPYHDETIETGSFGVPVNTASIQVHSGVWLLFSDPGFQGMLAVLETGVYPFPEAWGFPSPFVGSLRPLKMGGFKVENPSEVKAVVYEKPGFEGPCLEIDSEVLSFCDSEGDGATDGEYPHLTKVKSVGSLKVIGGLWVGYCEPGFEGQQHILEEGEYLDCNEWGGSDQLLSLRPILGDFMSPHVKMFSNPDLGDIGVNIDFTVAVINMEDTGYGVKTQSIDVISGIWVVFEEPGFCGESYILEKGLYGSPEDWGALQPRVGSAMPVVMDDLENAAKFKMQLFSKPSFQGNVLALEDGVASLQDGFCVASCKVLAGSWLGYEGQDYTGRKYVLEVGSYPDLRAMGCFHASSSILSLQTIGFEFSLPSITLFERGGLRGKRVVLTDGLVNLQLAGGCSRVQSVLVEGGMWILYEEINYRGAQILLKPGEVPDWHEFSSWRKIGSLRPLIQKQVHFRLRNSETGLLMSVSGDLDEVKLLRIQELEETGGFEQIWSYQNGHLHCKIVEECCLGPSGTVILAGSRVGLKTEPSNEEHLWSLTPEGYIRYTPTPDLVLEVKGGNHYDKNQVILNKLDPNKPHQRWYVEII